MQIQTTGNLNFTGKKEVLRDLGNALVKSQDYAIARKDFIVANPKGIYRLDEEEVCAGPLASVREFLNSATQDNAFSEVIKDIKESLSKKIRLELDGKSKKLTLPEIAKSARVFNDKEFNLFGISLDRFNFELSKMVKSKNLGVTEEEIDSFTHQIKPEDIRKRAEQIKNGLEELYKYTRVGANY